MSRTLSNRDPRPKLPSVRRYGPSDIDRFESLSVGYKSIGRVDIDCTLRASKSKWGALGNPGSPAGILYLDLNFKQPPDCKIDHATVSLTLEETVDADPDSVRITTFGPGCIVGEPKTKRVTRTVNLTPTFEAFGYGAGGLGVDKEETTLCTTRWMLRGHRPPGSTGLYKMVEWTLEENERDSQNTHSSIFKTAFAFTHNRDPVILKVEIKGKLERRTDRIKEKLKFSSRRGDGRANAGTTLINFEGEVVWNRCLRALEEGLERAMEEENYQAVPIQIPDPQPAVFTPVVPMPGMGRPLAETLPPFDGPFSTNGPGSLPSISGHNDTEPSLANLINYVDSTYNPNHGRHTTTHEDQAQGATTPTPLAAATGSITGQSRETPHSEFASDDTTLNGDAGDEPKSTTAATRQHEPPWILLPFISLLQALSMLANRMLDFLNARISKGNRKLWIETPSRLNPGVTGTPLAPTRPRIFKPEGLMVVLTCMGFFSFLSSALATSLLSATEMQYTLLFLIGCICSSTLYLLHYDGMFVET